MSSARSRGICYDPECFLPILQELTDLNCNEVQQKLNKYFQEKTGAMLSFLSVILPDSEEMVIHVIGETILERELRFPVLNHALYTAAVSRYALTHNTVELDERLLKHIEEVVDPVPDTFLSIPIQHPIKEHSVLVVCLFNNNFTQDASVSTVRETFRYCFCLFASTFKCQEESRIKVQCQDLLEVSKRLFSRLGDLPDLLREIMMEARRLTKSERCSLFLLEQDSQELVAKVFDGLETNASTPEVRIAMGQGIAGHVLETGKLLNVKNAYDHPLFYRGVDEATGFVTKNILCFPIRDPDGIVGVAQLCNKINGQPFDLFDEEVAVSFSVYCGISIMHSILYKNIQDAQARSKLSNELMMYHMSKVEEEDVHALLNCNESHDIEDFDQFHFSPRTIPHQHMPCYVIKMFSKLNFIQPWRIRKTTLARFILYVKKGYRDAPYHNWVHAFSVAHFAYLLIKNLNLVQDNYMTPLQAVVFLVSCLCHDIDHRGTNNSFQTKCGTALAGLYSSEGSVMERHHLAQSMCILNTEGCNIFENFNSDEYSEGLDLLKYNILATDLATHFRSVEKQEELTSGFNKEDVKHQKLLYAMLMTCCDLSDQTKHWSITKQTAEKVYEEFFSQGDLEKSMGTLPIEMMDRDRASIPDLQVQFISNIVKPLFVNLSKLFRQTQPLLERIEVNRKIWEVSKTVFEKYRDVGINGMDILLHPNVEEEVLVKFRTVYETDVDC